jgi:hypothetical protein
MSAKMNKRAGFFGHCGFVLVVTFDFFARESRELTRILTEDSEGSEDCCGVRRHVAAFKARTCPRTPNFIPVRVN